MNRRNGGIIKVKNSIEKDSKQEGYSFLIVLVIFSMISSIYLRYIDHYRFMVPSNGYGGVCTLSGANLKNSACNTYKKKIEMVNNSIELLYGPLCIFGIFTIIYTIIKINNLRKNKRPSKKEKIITILLVILLIIMNPYIKLKYDEHMGYTVEGSY